MAGGRNGGRLAPAVLTFIMVAGAIYLTGRLATAILKTVVLPLLAVIIGIFAARVVYRTRD
ncbi:MAG TPA: hypothetical protein VFQ85_02990 [Mycobacteriales bacterium]|jgi:hypothetical protein|nr:hypothetical protein [Mycobacteriales bacterium]